MVNRNSEETYKDAYANKRTLMSQYSDTLLSLPVGTVYGPYYEGGSFKLSKVTERQTLPDSVKVRLIRVVTKAQDQVVLADSAAKKRVDSAVAAINGGAPFAEVAAKFSDDESSKTSGGEYTFTVDQKTSLLKELADAFFLGKTGDKKTITVNTDNLGAIFYIEVLEQKAFIPAVKIATIVKALSPGTVTDQNVYSKAMQFAGKNATAAAFDEATKNNPAKRTAENIKINDFAVQGLEGGNIREVIRWVYEAKVGDVSTVFSLDGRYIVAKLSGEQKKGLPNITDVNRPQLEREFKAEKKAEIIVNKYKGMTSLDAIAQAAGQTVQLADSISAGNMYAERIGYEPKVMGYAFYKGLQPNAVSPAIKGKEAVFFISVLNRWESPMPEMPGMVDNQRRMMEMQLRNGANGTMMEMLRKNAEIKYNPKNL
jgi:peptidyl-prolyl cis-trans isomerase D